jgi:hypothetical protein
VFGWVPPEDSKPSGYIFIIKDYIWIIFIIKDYIWIILYYNERNYPTGEQHEVLRRQRPLPPRDSKIFYYIFIIGCHSLLYL